MNCPDDILEEFIGRFDADATLTVAAFASQFPDEQRDAIERRCSNYLKTRAELVAARPHASMPQRIGLYTIDRVLGVGGMGTVYAARDENGTDVAIKALHPHLGISQVQRKRLRREHVIGSDLVHPHLVEVMDLGEDSNGLFLVMRQVLTGSLADEIEVCRNNGTTIGFDRVVAVGIAIGEALACLHRNQVIHRDVKPHNILLEADGSPRLSDYGLARLRDNLHSRLTTSGQAVGTASYMSPEQALALTVGVDHRTDIYSLGVVLYELLTLRVPFEESNVRDLQRRITLSQVPPPSRFRTDIPSTLETICLKAISQAPRDRYQTAADLVADLKRYEANQPITARRDGPARRFARRVRWHWRTAAPLAAIALVVAISMQFGQSEQCTVTITSRSAGDVVHVRRMDGLSGQYGPPERLGVTPLTMPLEVGAVRFVVVDSQGQFAELSRRLTPGELQLTAAPSSIDAARNNMVTVAAGMPPTKPNGPDTEADIRQVAAFLMDTHEVTNGEYDDFLKKTGARQPDWWPAQRDARWRSLPVCCVNLGEATAYAEWAGKRLPTLREWQLAAAGPASRRVPWSGVIGDVTKKANVGKVAAAIDARENHIPPYYQHAAPVGSHPLDRTESGIFDLLGNVREWSDSVTHEASATGPVADYAGACIHGSGFIGPAEPLIHFTTWRAHTPMGRTDVGFRCAKSLSLP